MIMTKEKLRILSKGISEEFKLINEELYHLLNNNLPKMLKDRRSYWNFYYNNFRAIKNIHLNFRKITNLEDFIFYSFYYISQDEKFKYHIFIKNDYCYSKIMDIVFVWSHIGLEYDINMEIINRKFREAYETIIVQDLHDMVIKDKNDLKLKIEKII